jgi:hypothetical protein
LHESCPSPHSHTLRSGCIITCPALTQHYGQPFLCLIFQPYTQAPPHLCEEAIMMTYTRNICTQWKLPSLLPLNLSSFLFIKWSLINLKNNGTWQQQFSFFCPTYPTCPTTPISLTETSLSFPFNPYALHQHIHHTFQL